MAEIINLQAVREAIEETTCSQCGAKEVCYECATRGGPGADLVKHDPRDAGPPEDAA